MFEKYFALALTASAVTFASGCGTMSDQPKEVLPVTQKQIDNSQNVSESKPEVNNNLVQVTYYSETVDKIQVIYHNDESKVTVIMPDGRKFELPQAMSASGIRFTKDDSTVFWSKGPAAQFWIDNKLVFSGEERANY